MEDAKSTDIIKCTNCNASMRFSIKDHALKCPHCGHVQQIEKGNDNLVRREITNSALTEHEPWIENVIFRCNFCNADIDADKNGIMKKCPFCGNPNILRTEEIPGIKPDSLIPYTVTKESALDLFRKWIHSKIYAPGKCRRSATAENISSVYSPVWSFTARTQSRYNGVLGEDYTETHTDSKGNTYTTTHTRWYHVSGNISADYTDVFIPSGKLIPKKMAHKLEPYPMKKAVGYRQEYLADRAAEHYSRDLNTCFNEFKSYVYSDLCQRIKRKYGADHIREMNIDTNYVTKYFNYILLPNYIANFWYKEKNYNFYVNGATGEVVGRYPISAWKVMFTAAAVTAAIILIADFLWS
ncbi:MAG: hypothetical protein LBV13_00945 [Methanomassiliicoccaceae archaeon]|jgi:predicted RNA-binding Zn-ribbon protein involved in translation (DUF1610 family)|nr:hypothetical protein [Methanomassiliicoccaceae archaeon]